MTNDEKTPVQAKEKEVKTAPSSPNPARLVKTQKLPTKLEFAENAENSTNSNKKISTNDE